MTEREALTHLKTLVRMALESDDADTTRKLLAEMNRIIDKRTAGSAVPQAQIESPAEAVESIHCR